MQKFTLFLQEKSERVERNTPLSIKETLDKLLKVYSKEDIGNILRKRFGLIRADKANPKKCYISSPSKNIRVSPFAKNNYYNLFFSNNEAWSKYPVRNKSLICGSNTEMISGRAGDEFILIPLNPKSNIGICPSDDIWTSFKSLKHSDLAYFTTFIKGFMTVLVMKEPERFKKIPSDTDYTEFKSFLDLITIDDLKKYATDNKMFYQGFSDKNFYEILTDMFNPDKNGFKLMPFDRYISFDSRPDEELWIGDDCIMIPLTLKNKILNGI
jgi:hypothetical protein